MIIATLRDLWVEELQDLINAEKQILKALPKMAGAAHDDELREAFQHHLRQTEGHVDRLEQIFDSIDESGRTKKCKGMEGVIAEGKELLEATMPEHVTDAALIGAAQRVEHYEIAAYGTARSYAELLGETDAATLLDQTLEEEKETDQRLTALAEHINPGAISGGNGAIESNPRAKSTRAPASGS